MSSILSFVLIVGVYFAVLFIKSVITKVSFASLYNTSSIISTVVIGIIGAVSEYVVLKKRGKQ